MLNFYSSVNNGGTIRFFKGERVGNGINYSYDEFWLGDEKDSPSETTDTDVQPYFSSSGWTTSIKKTEMPDRTVMFLAIAYGKKLYFISNNRTESDVRAGILTQTEDNLLLWSEQPIEKVSKLNEKAGAVWYRDK